MISFSLLDAIAIGSLACCSLLLVTSAKVEDGFSKIQKSGGLQVVDYKDLAPFSGIDGGVDTGLATIQSARPGGADF